MSATASVCVSFPSPQPAAHHHHGGGAGPVVAVVLDGDHVAAHASPLMDRLAGASMLDNIATAAAAAAEEEECCYGAVRKPREVVQRVVCQRKALGDGFALRRSIGRPELESLDPFISLDEFEYMLYYQLMSRLRQLQLPASLSPPAGFSDHPHRGFENVTYMLEGGFSYHDFSGHKGTISTGDVQWMTAGRGVVHAEMPAGQGVQRGLNLWINLSSKDKMVEPRYQELASDEIPAAEKDGVRVKVIAGEALGARSPLQPRTPAMFLDVTMRPGARLRQPVPDGWSAFAYVIDGEATFGSSSSAAAVAAGAHQCVVFGGDGDGVDVRVRDDDAHLQARFLLVAARPHGEAVVRDGPFVMNTKEEVEQAREDYKNRRNGFEMAAGWTSDHAATAVH